jgi:hypothetical protein
VPEADEEEVLVYLTQLVDNAQENLIELALTLARSGHATSCPIGAVPPAPAETVEDTGRIVRPEERVSYRIADVAERTGVSIASVRKHLGKNIRFRKVDGMVLLDPGDVHRTFGFIREDAVAPSAEALAEIEELLQ